MTVLAYITWSTNTQVAAGDTPRSTCNSIEKYPTTEKAISALEPWHRLVRGESPGASTIEYYQLVNI